MKSALLACAALAVATGCQPPAPSVAAEPPLLTTTSVHLGDDGSTEISVLRETQQEREARIAVARGQRGGGVADATVADPCTDATYSDVYLCDSTNQYCSGGNVACIYGYGTIALAGVPRGSGGNWSRAVRQYEPDAWTGHFFTKGGATCSQFAAGYSIVSADACAQSATSLAICKAKGALCGGTGSASCCSGVCAAGGVSPLLAVCL